MKNNLVLRFLLLLTVVAFLTQISLIELSLGFGYYYLLIIVFFLILMIEKKVNFNITMIWMVLAGFLSIISNEIPTYFQPYKRLVAFIFVVALIGPMIRSYQLHKFRFQLFKILTNITLFMVVLSFIGITLGIPIMTSRSGFSGLFNHSMMLGPMSAIAILVALHKAYTNSTRSKFWFFIILASIAFITCVAAGSRSALLAGIIGSFFFYYKLNQGKLTHLVKIISVIILIGIFSFPIWKSYTERLIGKIEYSEDQGDALVTRAALWEMRVSEFKSSPLLGVGFAAVDTGTSIKFNEEDGRVEPGSSWLAVLSMTGLFGFIPILILVGKYINYVFKDHQDPIFSAFLGGLLLLFIVHMLAEGYVLSAGSGLFFYFWLILGIIEIMKSKSYKIQVK